jgi:glycosyltransferase involved in cell wall biosynthesis
MQQVKLNIEGLQADMQLRSWEEAHGITLCCSILNEESNLESFIEYHSPYVNKIVVIDGGSVDRSVAIASKYADVIKVVKFNGHYANQKNRAIELAKTDWVLFLDPDERMSPKALVQLSAMISQDSYDCFSFPRNNFINNVPDNSKGFDYQDRMFRSYCRYVRATHEEIVGFKSRHKFDDMEMAMDHRKPMDRHVKRNNTYTLFDLFHINELGFPGCQTSKTFSDKYGVALKSMQNMLTPEQPK